jgi:hypothetical protein
MNGNTDRMQRLLKALEAAERAGNTFMVANLKVAIRELAKFENRHIP